MTDHDTEDANNGMELGYLLGNIPFLTRALRAHVRAENADFYADVGAQQGEIVVICLIGLNPGTSQQDVASTLVLKKSAVTKVIKELEDRGIVRREKVAQDKRYNALFLTPAGEERYSRIQARMADQHQALIEPFSEAEQKQLFALLNRLLAHLISRSDTRRASGGLSAEDADD
ncbi:MarR family winged helix-turn-helix transcriptional regulator [Devosia sp. XJ19-1]|uniref:MarR family winged helix-turn-helix transcriptional regulator n=1 Tax=Devosia ureilytica TaxID=2952754 RepID=A0A9Q4FQF9_9HYPH|nr:MarR family winged helix-turn-helix transcriptional regulator [Devosia ureilytica]MCP8882103.1 MarR family winged helix-turn-helix transcriptional regulator [Devosia ureilytica]MCP8886011.1 MarR family winged helix-turn-helix transcriptional regulator [Devosia ureilytica]